MAEFPPPQSSVITVNEPPVTAAVLAYALLAIAVVTGVASSGLLALAPLVGIAGIAAVIVAYVKRGDSRGTWVESHFNWLIRTFWWSLGWTLIGSLAFVTLIGIPIAIAIWVGASIWGIYRVVRGFLVFKDNRPITA